MTNNPQPQQSDRLQEVVQASDRRPLESWLEEHHDALVGAVNPNGASVEMPASIPLGPGHRADSRSLLDLVVAADSKVVTDAFVASLVRGIGVARIHLSSEPDQSFLLHYLDLRSQHGVILRMMVRAGDTGDDHDRPVGPAEFESVRPRLAVMTKNEVATICSIDPAVTLMLGWSAEEMVGHSTLEFIHPDDHVRAIDNWMSRLTSEHGNTIQAVRLRYLCKEGNWLWLETSNYFQTPEDGETVVVAQMIDVSDEMAATEALRHNERFLRELTDTVPVGLFHVNRDGSIAFVNPVLHSMIGGVEVGSHSELAGVMSPNPSLLENAIVRVMNDGGDADLELSLSEGSSRTARVALRAVTDGEKVLGVLGCVVDVTELKSLADTDALTGLQNRRSIVELLELELVRHPGNVSVIFADLDGFKEINDEFGHQVGDQLLTAVAERLRSALRPGDRIGRLGGDEFLVICPGLSEVTAATAVAERLRGALNEKFNLTRSRVRIMASLGVACGEPGSTADDLILRSDSAMYESKQSRDFVPRRLLRRPSEELAPGERLELST